MMTWRLTALRRAASTAAAAAPAAAPPPRPLCRTAVLARRALEEGSGSSSGSGSGGGRSQLSLRHVTPAAIRNFAIIAHIDHGKSTLSDRLLEHTGTLRADRRDRRAQVLDKLAVEQQRGITVKAQTASNFLQYGDQDYQLNLIDTPGHVDFNYEVRCSLAACQGALLVVDATQGVQAQTVANFYLAFERDVDKALSQLESLFDIKPEDAVLVSAKTGHNIDQLLNAIVARIPPPTARSDAPLKLLLFDSWFDTYRGVVMLMEVMDGRVAAGDTITSAHWQHDYEVQEVGIMYPDRLPVVALDAGQVGYVICNLRKRDQARVGDTFYRKGQPVTPLPGFQPPKSMVFAGLYPVEQVDYETLATALERLVLNDPAVAVRRDVSAALGPGWRLGFLGMLHMDVFCQRLELEHNVQTLLTSPSVSFRAVLKDGKGMVDIESAAQFPEAHLVAYYEEPMVLGTLTFPAEYTGPVLALCEERRGRQQDLRYLDDARVLLKYKLPLSEVVENFFDRLKSITSGYAAFEYDDAGYEKADLVKLQIMLNGDPVDALSCVLHTSRAFVRGKAICQRLKETISRQLYDVAVQAFCQGRVIARETVKAVRKDVTAKCHGGDDVGRKRKLLDRQKEGKKKMRMIGAVELPKEAFLTVLSSNNHGKK